MQLVTQVGTRLSPYFPLLVFTNLVVLIIQAMFLANYFSSSYLKSQPEHAKESENRFFLETMNNFKKVEEDTGKQIKSLYNDLELMREKLTSIRAVADKLSCHNFGIGSKGGFCLSDQSVEVGGNQVWNVDLAKEIERLVGNGSIVDLGAGLGWYGRYFTRNNNTVFPEAFLQSEMNNYFNRSEVMESIKAPKVVTKYEGYDGGVNVEHYTTGFIKSIDLSEKQVLPHKFDWVMSLEVGEHIPKEYEQVFIDNLVRHACRGIVLSWAVEGQGGHFHVNNHNNSYVKEQFDRRGFRDCPKQDVILRRTSATGGYWFANTLMLFLRKEPLDGNECRSEYPEVDCDE